MENFGSLSKIKELDKSNMLDLLLEFPEQCEKGVELGNSWGAESGKFNINNIVFTGLGGSAIGGDILGAYLSGELKVPVYVNRDYFLPEFVGENTLFIAVSYSGNTEETLSAYKVALKKGAKIFVITSGGQLGKLAEENSNPTCIIPKGMPPRTALGYLLFPALGLISKLGLIAEKSGDIKETILLLKNLRDRLKPENENDNEAKKITELIFDRIPLVYSPGRLFNAVALRWKTQINENSKVHCFVNSFSELNHNEIVGWDAYDKLTKDYFVLLLRDENDFDRIKTRIDVTKQVMDKKPAGIYEVWSKGDSVLGKIFSLIYIGDFVSFYLAVAYGQDPTTIKPIDFLKKELSKR